jgi:hypothetical protein
MLPSDSFHLQKTPWSRMIRTASHHAAPWGSLDWARQRCHPLIWVSLLLPQRAIEELQKAQERVEEARAQLNGKQEARDAAVQRKLDTETELQVAKYFAEHFAHVWEAKEAQVPKATEGVHRAEVGKLQNAQLVGNPSALPSLSLWSPGCALARLASDWALAPPLQGFREGEVACRLV